MLQEYSIQLLPNSSNEQYGAIFNPKQSKKVVYSQSEWEEILNLRVGESLEVFEMCNGGYAKAKVVTRVAKTPKKKIYGLCTFGANSSVSQLSIHKDSFSNPSPFHVEEDQKHFSRSPKNVVETNKWFVPTQSDRRTSAMYIGTGRVVNFTDSTEMVLDSLRGSQPIVKIQFENGTFEDLVLDRTTLIISKIIPKIKTPVGSEDMCWKLFEVTTDGSERMLEPTERLEDVVSRWSENNQWRLMAKREPITPTKILSSTQS